MQLELSFSPLCEFCGEDRVLEVLEVFSDREFQIETCCEWLHDAVVEAMNDDLGDKQLRSWFEQQTGMPLRRLIDHAGGLLLDYGLQIIPVEFAEAWDFVRQYHRHNKPPIGWKYGAGITNGGELMAVTMAGRPVARLIDATTTVEINRVCVKPTTIEGLTWNACSMLYGWAAREAEKRGYSKIITYTLETEAGTSLKAAGFTPEARTKGGTWNTPSRKRRDKAPTIRKVRWARLLNPRSTSTRSSSLNLPLSSIEAISRC